MKYKPAPYGEIYLKTSYSDYCAHGLTWPSSRKGNTKKENKKDK